MCTISLIAPIVVVPVVIVPSIVVVIGILIQLRAIPLEVALVPALETHFLNTLILLWLLLMLSLVLLALLLLLWLWGSTVFGLMAHLLASTTSPDTLPIVMIATLAALWLLSHIRTLILIAALALIN